MGTQGMTSNLGSYKFQVYGRRIERWKWCPVQKSHVIYTYATNLQIDDDDTPLPPIEGPHMHDEKET